MAHAHTARCRLPEGEAGATIDQTTVRRALERLQLPTSMGAVLSSWHFRCAQCTLHYHEVAPATGGRETNRVGKKKEKWVKISGFWLLNHRSGQLRIYLPFETGSRPSG